MGCGPDDECLQFAGSYFCKNAKELCDIIEDKKGECEKMNKSLLRTNNYSCALSIRYSITLTDKCSWDKRIFCPKDTTRVPCISGPEWDKKTKAGCWMFKDNIQEPILYTDAFGLKAFKVLNESCSDDNFANVGANSICCKDSSNISHIHLKRSSWSFQPYIPTCSKVKKCEVGSEANKQYESQDALTNDPCNVCL